MYNTHIVLEAVFNMETILFSSQNLSVVFGTYSALIESFDCPVEKPYQRSAKTTSF